MADTARLRRAGGTVPGTTVMLLSHTSKMPGPSWSLPAHEACPREYGTICAACYAGKGCYRHSTTRNAQSVRFHWTRECMRTPAGRAEWVTRMVAGIRLSGCDYFRVHDSGDMYSQAYTACWFEICRQMPDVRFWIPTRAWQQPSGPLPVLDPLLGTLRRLAELPNVAVRPSALNFGDYTPDVPGLHAGSTAGMPDMYRAKQCHARENGGHCGDCRVCWDDKEVPVNYHKH